MNSFNAISCIRLAISSLSANVIELASIGSCKVTITFPLLIRHSPKGKISRAFFNVTGIILDFDCIATIAGP